MYKIIYENISEIYFTILYSIKSKRPSILNFFWLKNFKRNLHQYLFMMTLLQKNSIFYTVKRKSYFKAGKQP